MIKNRLTAMIFVLGLSMHQVDATALEGMTEKQIKVWRANAFPNQCVGTNKLQVLRGLPSSASSLLLCPVPYAYVDSLESIDSLEPEAPSSPRDLLDQYRNENIRLRILIAQLTTKINKMELERKETQAAHDVKAFYLKQIEDLNACLKKSCFVDKPNNPVFVKMSKKIEDLGKQYKDAMNCANIAVLESIKSKEIWLTLMRENTVLKTENAELKKKIEGLMELTQNK